MSRFWSPVVRTLTPYVPGEQPAGTDLVKLNTNENPYGPSPRVLEVLRSTANASLRLYPDPESKHLRSAVGSFCGLRPEHVFVGNGSDEVLAFAFQALLNHDQPLLFPDVTYSFYPVYCELYGIAHETVAVTDDFEIRLEDYERPNGGVIFPNPNAPTGVALPRSAVENFLKRNTGSVVVVDEAYVDFGAETVVPLVREYPNLLVIQTLSKARSLAGLRVGFALGDPALIEALDRVKNSFNSYPIDRLAAAGAAAAMEDRAYFEETRRAIMATRALMTRDLQELGFQVLPSAANFVFARHPGWEGGVLAEELRARNIIVRHFRKPRIEQFLRVTVGSEPQRIALRRALEEILRG